MGVFIAVAATGLITLNQGFDSPTGGVFNVRSAPGYKTLSLWESQNRAAVLVRAQ